MPYIIQASNFRATDPVRPFVKRPCTPRYFLNYGPRVSGVIMLIIRRISRPRRPYLWSSLTFIALINFTSGRRMCSRLFSFVWSRANVESTSYHCLSSVRVLIKTYFSTDRPRIYNIPTISNYMFR